MVNVRGVFEEPRDVKEFTDCCGGKGKRTRPGQDDCQNCYDDSSTDYPIPMDMLSLINQGILAGELNLLSSSVSDITNDRMQDRNTPAPKSK